MRNLKLVSLLCLFPACTEDAKPPEIDFVAVSEGLTEKVHTSGIPKSSDRIWLNQGSIVPAEIDGLQEFLDRFGAFKSGSKMTCNEEANVSTAGVARYTVCSTLAQYRDGSELEHRLAWKVVGNEPRLASYDLVTYGPPLSATGADDEPN